MVLEDEERPPWSVLPGYLIGFSIHGFLCKVSYRENAEDFTGFL